MAVRIPESLRPYAVPARWTGDGAAARPRLAHVVAPARDTPRWGVVLWSVCVLPPAVTAVVRPVADGYDRLDLLTVPIWCAFLAECAARSGYLLSRR